MNPQNSLARLSSCFTAAQIAVAAGISKQAVQKALAGIASAGSVIVRGNEAPAWSVDQLPARISEKLAVLARQDGLSIADFLATAGKRWQSPVALADVDEACLDTAKKLRAALLPSLQRMDSPIFTPAEIVRLGLQDYDQAFGHSITERHWRRLMDRTLRRDAGAGDFQQLEIYLPDKPACKRDAKRLLPAEMHFKALTDLIQGFADPSEPTRPEIAGFWAEAFELYQAGADTKRERRAVRRELVKFLFRHAPWLAATKHALRVSFDRKFEKWNADGQSAAALLDGREMKRGKKRATEIPQADVDQIVWHAHASCGGRVAQALRDFAARGTRSDLSAETVEIISRHHKSKSQFNRRLVARVAGDVKAIKPYSMNKKFRDDSMAHIERDYSKLASLEIVNADDFTFPVYFYVPDGNGWFNLTRGQCLLMLDVRSWKVIAWCLLPDRNYNSLAIRTLMNNVCTGWGIPGTWYLSAVFG